MDATTQMAVGQKLEHLEPDLERVARANLKELGDIRIDDVLAFIDRGIENMPSYMDLYRRWESQQWSVGDLDFTHDRQDGLQATDLE
jgi:DNA-binding ferritin-like protein (Dps family)